MKIHQMLPNYWYGDAIGNCVTEMGKLLRSWGHESEVFADVVHEKLSARPYTEFETENEQGAWLIYHYSTGSRVNRYALENAKNIILMYHNITPAEFFEGYDDNAAKAAREGREVLAEFAGAVKLAMAGSPYNEKELISLGFKNTAVTPYLLDFDRIPPTGSDPFGDGKTNILFVGRIAPNKRYEDLIKVFYFYRNYVDKNSRLVLVGGYSPDGGYYKSLRKLVDTLDLPDVVFTGFVPDEEIGDYFASASFFLSMSRHEGFCIPLLEAMRFRVPVVALASTGVVSTMDYAGVLVNGAEYNEIAELLGVIKEDRALRGKIIESQLSRLEDFSYTKMAENFKNVIHKAVAIA